jgi:1,4-dihydroxy-2-naphthoyl-CoA synthase
MSYENILLKKEDKLSIITINRPESLNALNAKTIQEISTALDELDSDNSCRVIILTGSGEKSLLQVLTSRNSVTSDRKKLKNLQETDKILCSTKLKTIQTCHCSRKRFCIRRRFRACHGMPYQICIGKRQIGAS